MRRYGTVLAIGAALIMIAVAFFLARRSAREVPADAGVSEIIPKIEAAMRLSFKSPPQVDSRSTEQVREFLLRQIEDSAVARELAGQEAALKVLRMIPDSVQLHKVLVDVLEEQIVGYYDPRTKVLYVVESADPAMKDVTLTHELIHAMQDQYVSLDSIQNIRGEDDRQLAAHAIMEGQATLEHMTIMFGELGVPAGGWTGVRELIRNEQSKMPRFAAAPLVVQEMLLFPYLSGAEFVRRFKEHYPDSNIFANMPVSTEQILHTSAYFGTRDDPSGVELPALSGVRQTYANTLGEFGVRLFLFSHLNDEEDALRGAMGWDGDRFAVFDVGSGRGIVWVSVWDTAVDAGEFQDLTEISLQRRFRGDRPTRVAESQRPGTISGVEYVNGGRRIFVGSAELAGKPVVIYIDVPHDASWGVVDVRQVKIQAH